MVLIVDKTTTINPPTIRKDFDGGHNPKYSTFALIDLSPNPFYSNKPELNQLRKTLSKNLEYSDRMKEETVDQILGLNYDEHDKYNGTILWAKNFKEFKEKDQHSYIFEGCAIFTVDSQDRMYGNTYHIAALTKVGNSFYTFLAQQEFEKEISFSEEVKRASAIVRVLRGSWGNKRTDGKTVMPYAVDEPIIKTVKIPFHNFDHPPITGKYEMFEGRDEDTLKKLSMYDPKMLRFSKGLTTNLMDMLAEKDPAYIQSGGDLRFMIHDHLFPRTSPKKFTNIDQSSIPEHLSDYALFKIN